jgi:hypothetical protein
MQLEKSSYNIELTGKNRTAKTTPGNLTVGYTFSDTAK